MVTFQISEKRINYLLNRVEKTRFWFEKKWFQSLNDTVPQSVPKGLRY